ncbi:MAG: hypothetical protein HN995_07290 [Candidatus Marinimicrobia bacterium]|nr:hypothetical protein [Candidatus Neomarinimicrobiota bacterium]MBT3574605.1 hypothetical protein [Candidatus Neomarinimicrobiota bacterium]MBT3680319.1 hypothetical protein [Candidatus Neomarinimicrobiota bacterium]MBT3950927.1 hypothetical protein [Candidatus Neomarinimicrobiota bacterium]MBT4252225.1 hypothetical protein [Candidatus Neomarinimicrobiota bacterium]
MNKIFNNRFVAGFILLCSVSLILTCELITPETYSESENSISSFDDQACALMTRDYIRIDTVISGTDTSVVRDTLYLAQEAKSNAFTTRFDSLVFDANSTDVTQLASLMDSIAIGIEMISPDTTNMVYLNGSTAYLHFPNDISGIFTVFVSWAFNGNNVNDYISIDFIDENGVPANIHNQDMPLETVSGCTIDYIVDEDTGENAHTAAIKTRTSFNLNSNPYLMRIKLTQFIAGTSRVPLHIALLQND